MRDSLHRADGRICSGEALSSREGVSRAQVWKHIETLRGRGYQIDAAPGEGYRLTGVPDRLYPEEIERGLETRWLGREIHYFEEIASTNRVALELARDGHPQGTVVIAEGQTAGRGRLGRSFFSPSGLNLYTSIVLRPDLTLERAPTWILATAVAVADSIARFVDADDAVEIKWPNDVLLGGLKTSGILMELGAEATRVAHLVLGIGVNLNVDREDFPDEFRSLATSLASHAGHPIDRAAFTRDLYASLERTLDACVAGSFERIRERFEARFRMRGREIRVIDGTGTGSRVPGANAPGGELHGTALGIDAAGALRVGRSAGTEVRVIAGDVTLAKAGERQRDREGA